MAKGVQLLNIFSHILARADYFSMVEGKRYFARGQVIKLDFLPGKISAVVSGTSRYNVILSLSPRQKGEFTCSCPSYRSPCKHVVAALLAAQNSSPYQAQAFFSKIAKEYLQIAEIKNDQVLLQAVKRKMIKGKHSFTAEPENIVKAHKLCREIGLTLDFENNLLKISKENLVNLLQSKQLPLFFNGLLSTSGKELKITKASHKLLGLSLVQQNGFLTLELTYGGLQKKISLSPETIFYAAGQTFDPLDRDDDYDYHDDFDDDFAYDLKIKSHGLPQDDGLYLTSDEILIIPFASTLMEFSRFAPQSSKHSFLVNHARKILESEFTLYNFEEHPAPPLKSLKPEVKVILTEEKFSRAYVFLEARLHFIYEDCLVPAGDTRSVVQAKNEYYGRDFEFENGAHEKLYGQNRRYKGRMDKETALEFLFQKLPDLPDEWETDKSGLYYFDFYDQSKFDIAISSSKDKEAIDWLEIRFDAPDKLKNSFSKKMIRDILLKKSKYIYAGGKWLYCSDDLVQSISLAYFVGPHILNGEREKISPFQVMGLWQYLRANQNLTIPQKVSRTIEALRSFSGISLPQFSEKLNPVLRPYQKEGVAWLKFLHDHNLSGLLCDDMGLGKTLQSLALLWELKQRGELGQCVIVAPTSAVGSWCLEIEKFLPDLKKAVLEGKDRKEIYSRWKDYDLIITSYAIFCRDADILKKKKINYLILDEAQFIKNPNTQRARSVFAVKSERRLALTGTPLENRLSDLWSVFHFLMPGYLGSLDYFKDVFQYPVEKLGDRAPMEALSEKIRPFLLRRLKESVEKELPPKTEIPVFCELSEDQKKVYLHTLALVKQEVYAAIKKKGIENSYIHIFSALTKLRQICDHPGLIFDKPRPGLTSGKFESFKEMLMEALAENHYVLVFSQFTSMLSYIRKWLEKEQLSYLYLDGATKNRRELISKFENGKHPVFLISLKAGGTGITLTRADYVMHFDPWWNPAVENQATDRAHRIGQKRHVFVYKFYTRGTIEEKVLELQKKKQKLFDDIMGGSLNKPLKLSQQDLEEILEPNLA